jgi:tetratricopeptide (TPR) repeat protein
MKCVRCKGSEGGTQFCAECRRELREQKLDAAALSQCFEEAGDGLRVGDFATAGRHLQKLLRRDNRNLGAYELLILSHGYAGHFDKALAALQALHNVAPPVATTVVAKQPQEQTAGAKRRGRATTVAAESRGRRRTTLSSRVSDEPLRPLEKAIDMVSLGLFFRQLHELDLAETVLLAAARDPAMAVDAHLVLGSTYRSKGKLRQALRHLKQAQVGTRESASVTYEMGLCHEGLGQLKKAHQLVSKAVSLEPDNPHMHFSLGMLYEKLGRARVARREYRVASSLNAAFAPALVDISFRLGLSALEDGNVERALQEFQAGTSENPHLFTPAIMSEIDHLLVHIIRGEQVRNFLDEFPVLEQASPQIVSAIEEVFAQTARLAFYVGLSEYWDGYYDACSNDTGEASSGEVVYGPEAPRVATWEYEPLEAEATWLEGPSPSGRNLYGATSSVSRARRSGAVAHEGDGADEGPLSDELASVRAEVTRAEAVLGFPPVPFEFIFEEWLNVHATLASPRLAERPLVDPDIYHRLLAILGAGMRAVGYIVQQAGQAEVLTEEDSEADENVDLGMTLWATIIESFLLRQALEACRQYPKDFLVKLVSSERYRQRRFFRRAIRELEGALPLLPANASVSNFLWNLYIRERSFDEAARHCQAVLKFTPHYLFQAAAYNDLAYCMVEQGENLNLALLYTEKARELAPKLFDAHVADTVAWLHWRQGEFDQALELIDQVITAGRDEESGLTPTSIHYYHYGHILRSLGREKEAKAAFAQAVEMEVDAESDWGIAHRLRDEEAPEG